MIEVELKAVVPDVDAARRRVEAAGGVLQYEGRLEDRRYDWMDRALAERDHVLRLRIYRNGDGKARDATIDWKGPTSFDAGYKRREELNAAVGDADTVGTILDRIGLTITMAIDRMIAQYEVAGAVVRFERYPRMDDLVEVEGSPEAIERAIAVLALPRDTFTSDRLPQFVQRYEARTGERAALSDAERAGRVHYDPSDA